jgi:hypothetical protein
VSGINELAATIRAGLDADEQGARSVGVPLEWHQGPVEDPQWETVEGVYW